ncbi:IS1096 element passenger TnpR family protein [Niabella aquatica]
MAIFKFRIYFEEDDSIYRDVVIKHTQTFQQLHETILKAYEFDNKHQATFYRSNDNWQQGREITLEKYDKKYRVEPLIMAETTIGSEIKNTNQRFTYTYDFHKQWNFLIELINVSKDADSRTEYPSIVRSEGIGPKQYGTKGLLGDKFADIEEKYDLTRGAEGFNEKGEDGQDMSVEAADEYQDEED